MPRRKKAAADPALSFIAALERRLADNPPRQKGLRTRERLKLAAAKVLAERGYHGMRLTDVTEQAKVAEGLFYAYFKNKTEICLAVMASLEEFFLQELAPGAGETSPFEAIRRSNRQWIALYRANRGLVRCVLQVGDETPEFAELLQRTNRHWYSRVAARVIQEFPAGAVSPDAVLFVVYMLGAMMDEMARKIVIAEDSDFVGLLAAIGADDDVLAELASLLWMRCLYPGTPVEASLSKVAAGFADWPVPGPAAASDGRRDLAKAVYEMIAPAGRAMARRSGGKAAQGPVKP